jgi:hypothetical protein
MFLVECSISVSRVNLSDWSSKVGDCILTSNIYMTMTVTVTVIKK